MKLKKSNNEKRKYIIYNKCKYIGSIKQSSGKSLKELKNSRQTEYFKNPENRVIHYFNSSIYGKTFKIKKLQINKLLLECMVLKYKLYEYNKRN